MEDIKSTKDAKKYHKKKLIEDIQNITKKFPEIESYFRFKNNLENLNDEKLKMYIDILYQRNKDYEKINYFQKLKLIKSQYLLQKYKFDKYYNNKVLDLILLKEIQAEKEKNQIKSKKKFKKPLSAVPSKLGKNKIDNNFKMDTNKPKIININNYHPLKDLNIKKMFYQQNIIGKNNINNNINIKEKNNAIQIIEKLSNEILIWIDKNFDNLENSSYLKLLKTNKNLTIFCFDNVDDAFEHIIKKYKFREIFILSSGSLYPNLHLKLKENLNKITFLPINCIFTSFNLSKEIIINQNKYKDIKSSFYNIGGVKTNFIDCINFFKEYSQRRSENKFY